MTIVEAGIVPLEELFAGNAIHPAEADGRDNAILKIAINGPSADAQKRLDLAG